MTTSALFLALLPLATNLPATDPVIQGDAVDVDNEWSGSINLMYWKSTGNTETTNGRFYAEALREREMDRFLIELESFYLASVDQDTSVYTVDDRRSRLEGQYDYLAGERYYYYGKAGVFNDKNAKIDLRYLVGAGVGYDFYDTETFKLDGEAGLSYVSEDFSRVYLPGGGSISTSDTFVALNLGYDLKWMFSERSNVTQSTDILPAIDDFNDILVTVDTALNHKFSESMIGSLRYILRWDNRPAPGAGTTDRTIALTLGWTFNR